MGYVLGIDGGGSRTMAAIASDGRLVARASGPPSNVRTYGVNASIGILSDLVDRLLAEVPAPAELDAVCAGLAGVRREDERKPLLAWLETRFAGRPTSLVSDVELVLAAGTPDGTGVAIVAGTGSIVFARDRRGITARAGGWGPAIGDPGSGYAIGRAALAAITESRDGVRPDSVMSRLFRERSGPAGPDAFGPGAQPSEIAVLAELVAEAADSGDETAADILVAAGAALAVQAIAVARRLAFQGDVPAALAGGVLVNVPRVRETLLARARSGGLQLASVQIVDTPVTGAIRVAGALIGVRATQ